VRQNLGGDGGRSKSRKSLISSVVWVDSALLSGIEAVLRRPLKAHRPNQTGSNQIKPNQTCEGEVPMAHGVAREQNGVRRGFKTQSNLIKLGHPRMDANRRQSIQATARSNRIKPNQTCGAVGVSRNWTVRCGKRSADGSLVKPGQTQSNRYGEQVGAARRRRSRRTNDSRDHSWPEEFRG
jgi:hypothetical protein